MNRNKQRTGLQESPSADNYLRKSPTLASHGSKRLSYNGTLLDAVGHDAGKDKSLLARVQENKNLVDLPKIITDMHHNMPNDLKVVPMRLLKVPAVLGWSTIKVYEEVSLHECLDVPYSVVDDKIWDQTAVLSWRWGESKPPTNRRGFSPMSAMQFKELVTALHHAKCDSGMEYVWIDWCCVPQYSSDSMVEVMRSKVFYARARWMVVVPTFNKIPTGSVVRSLLRNSKHVLDSSSSNASRLAAAVVESMHSQEVVAGSEYFSRVWTLAERMARYGRDEELRNWLTLEAWLGMVVDAMMKSVQNKAASQIYRKILGKEAVDLLDNILEPLKAVEEAKSPQVPAAVGLATKIAELFEQATKTWQSCSILKEGPTKEWLKVYMEESDQGVYQAWSEGDRVWAVYSYFSVRQPEEGQSRGEQLLIALQDLAKVAGVTRKTVVGMAKIIGVGGLLVTADVDKKLMRAIADCNLLKVQKLIDNGANLHLTLSEGTTPLHGAAKKGNVDIVRTLLEAGAERNACNKKGYTPLHLAANDGHVEVLKALLDGDGGKDADRKTEAGMTPLYLAAQEGRDGAVGILLAKQVDKDVAIQDAELEQALDRSAPRLQPAAAPAGCLPNCSPGCLPGWGLVGTLIEAAAKAVLRRAPVQFGFRPLMVAAQAGHAKVVQLLLEKGADAHLSLQDGTTALHLAAEFCHAEVVRSLLKGRGIDVDARIQEGPMEGATALSLAARNGCLEVVQALLPAKAASDAALKDGSTPLFIAAERGHAAVVSELLKARARTEAAIKDGSTPLIIAAEVGHAQVVRLLLDGGAMKDAERNDKATPLFLAAKNGHAEVVEALLAKRANKFMEYKDGSTPLHIAAQMGWYKVVRILLRKGANKEAARKDGAKPLHLAAECLRVDARWRADARRRAGAPADALADSRAGSFVLNANADALDDYTKTVQALLEWRADVHATMRWGSTPLHRAAKRGHEPVARLLLLAGARRDVRNWFNKVPLDLAKAGSGLRELLKEGTPEALAVDQEAEESGSELTARGSGHNLALAGGDSTSQTPVSSASTMRRRPSTQGGEPSPEEAAGLPGLVEDADPAAPAPAHGAAAAGPSTKQAVAAAAKPAERPSRAAPSRSALAPAARAAGREGAGPEQSAGAERPPAARSSGGLAAVRLTPISKRVTVVAPEPAAEEAAPEPTTVDVVARIETSLEAKAPARVASKRAAGAAHEGAAPAASARAGAVPTAVKSPAAKEPVAAGPERKPGTLSARKAKVVPDQASMRSSSEASELVSSRSSSSHRHVSSSSSKSVGRKPSARDGDQGSQ